MNYPTLTTDYAARAQRTIDRIDQKAKMAAKLCSKSPLAAISILGEVRGMIEGLKVEVRIVTGERDNYLKLAREAMDLPPHPAESEPLYPITTEEAVEIDEAVTGDYLDYCRRMAEEEDAELFYELH